MWPYRRLAVCGSNRSLAISQKPEARIGPAAEIWRYTATAVASGAWDLSAHSIRNNTPLAANVAGTQVPGPALRAALALATTSAIEKAEVTSSIVGQRGDIEGGQEERVTDGLAADELGGDRRGANHRRNHRPRPGLAVVHAQRTSSCAH
jgi:hypothetical protein